MKKLTVAVASMFVVGLLSVTGAHAAPLNCTDIGCTGVMSDGYIIVADGAEGNPDPLDGFIGVTDGGSLDCDAQGGPYTGGTPMDAGCNPPA